MSALAPIALTLLGIVGAVVFGFLAVVVLLFALVFLLVLLPCELER